MWAASVASERSERAKLSGAAHAGAEKIFLKDFERSEEGLGHFGALWDLC